MENGIYSYKNESSFVEIDFFYSNEKEKLQYENFSLREIETQTWINSFEEDGVFLDIGANIGLFSLQAALTHPELKVISIEPHIPCFETLFQNIVLNKCDNVLPVNIAFSNVNQADTFNYMRTQSGTAKSVFGQSIDYRGKEFSPEFRLPALSLKGDSFFDMFQLDSPKYIKIDVDGIEIDVLRGMSRILKSSNLNSIMVEANSLKMEEELRYVMKKFKFELFQVQNKSWDSAKTRNNFFERR